jgi:hypothetical protein
VWILTNILKLPFIFDLRWPSKHSTSHQPCQPYKSNKRTKSEVWLCQIFLSATYILAYHFVKAGEAREQHQAFPFGIFWELQTFFQFRNNSHGNIGVNLQSWTKLCLKQQDQEHTLQASRCTHIIYSNVSTTKLAKVWCLLNGLEPLLDALCSNCNKQ